MGFNGISESFFHLRTPYEALFCSQCITLLTFTATNIFLSLHYTEILNFRIIPSTPYRTRQARSLGVFHGEPRSHPILRKNKFTTNINLWQFSVLNRSINSTLTRLISRPTIIISFFLSSFIVVSKITMITTGYIWSHTKEKPYQRNSLRKSFPQKISPIGSFLFFCLMNPRSTHLEAYLKNNAYFLPSINYSVR